MVASRLQTKRTRRTSRITQMLTAECQSAAHRTSGGLAGLNSRAGVIWSGEVRGSPLTNRTCIRLMNILLIQLVRSVRFSPRQGLAL